MEKSSLKQDNAEDIEDDATTGPTYLLRKRSRFARHVAEPSPYIYKRSYRRKNPIMHMPTEILQMIFSYLTNEELANSVRLVNHRFRIIAQFILNNNFKQLFARLDNLRRMLVDSIQHSKDDDMELRCMCKMLGTTEVLIFYHSVIKSSLWRYIYFQKPTSNVCMYGGSILDLYDVVLRQFIMEPHLIYSPGILRDYALSKEVKKICVNSKAFVLYFDKVSEIPINSNSFCSGSKIVDILDSATDVKRTVTTQKLIGNTLILKLKYHFTNSWFVTFDIPEEKPKMWNEIQRLMYMRLRRIVLSHSEMTMEYNQFRRETMIRMKPSQRIKKPINCVYTGYGEVGEKFFYYGVMNEGAYLNKFDAGEPDPMDRLEAIDDPMSELKNIPFLGLDISVELRCPLQLAPCKIIEYYENFSEETRSAIMLPPRKRLRGLFELKVDFECLAAKYPRLPPNYCHYLRSQR